LAFVSGVDEKRKDEKIRIIRAEKPSLFILGKARRKYTRKSGRIQFVEDLMAPGRLIKQKKTMLRSSF
jgi:hypothetical protein